MSWMVTGAAGYIGSHVAHTLQSRGREVVAVDNLSTGHRAFVPEGVAWVACDVRDARRLTEIMRHHGVTGVIHLAGFKYAGLSVKEPLRAYQDNVSGTMGLLQAMTDAEVRMLVFSSSAATYGTPDEEVVTEQTPVRPESPYGESKLIGEWLIADQGRATGLRHTSLRYFNVVGAGRREVADTSPHNLFPLIFSALDQGGSPKIFGTDYPTADGTCVRDYIHVQDLADVHVAAADRLEEGVELDPVYNIGSGTGTSVAEIMSTMKKVTGIPFDAEVCPRRPGDPSRIVADGAAARRDLGWAMSHSLEEMAASSWDAWRRFHR